MIFNIPLQVPETVNLTIFKYFEGGFTYTEIIEFLRLRHGYVIILSTLKRWLRKKRMRKRSPEAIRNDTSDNFKLFEMKVRLSGSGADIGYRRIHKALKSKGYICRSDDLRQIDKQVDIVLNWRNVGDCTVADGPNFVWHLDGHDKLKPFGFSIHYCIDGFSRNLI